MENDNPDKLVLQMCHNEGAVHGHLSIHSQSWSKYDFHIKGTFHSNILKCFLLDLIGTSGNYSS